MIEFWLYGDKIMPVANGAWWRPWQALGRPATYRALLSGICISLHTITIKSRSGQLSIGWWIICTLGQQRDMQIIQAPRVATFCRCSSSSILSTVMRRVICHMLAWRGEDVICKQRVRGSSPRRSTTARCSTSVSCFSFSTRQEHSGGSKQSCAVVIRIGGIHPEHARTLWNSPERFTIVI